MSIPVLAIITLKKGELAAVRGGSKISEKGFICINGVGVALLIIAKFS